MKRVLCLGAVLWGWVVGMAAPRPNILFILTDDLGYGDLGVLYQNSRAAAGNRNRPWFATPKLDTMAGEGLRLTRHYCPAPVCAPSRASLLLGVHQGHANVRDNQFDKALEDNHTLASVLKGAGYATAIIGKYGLAGDTGTSPATWPGYPTQRGFDYFYGYVRHVDGHYHYPKEFTREVWENNTEVSGGLDKCFTTDLWTARAKKWIVDQRTGNPGQPFFLYLAYDTPHARLQLPTQAYPSGGGVSGGVQWVGTAGGMINTASGTINSWLHPDYANATWDHDNNPGTAEQAWPDYAKYHATMLRRLDDAVADLIQTLKDLGIDNNTLVVFTSDNGTHNEAGTGGTITYLPTFFDTFGPLDGIKRDCWEGGIRMATLVRWPGGIAAGGVSNQASAFWDWMPTLAELAGVAAPARGDGVSLVPTLTGVGTQRTSNIYLEYYVNSTTPSYTEFEAAKRGRTRGQMQAVMMGNYKGVRYNISSHANNFEIYDVVNDPKETTNLAGSQTALQQQMKDRVLRVRRPDSGAARPYDSENVPAVDSAGGVAGLDWSAYEGTWGWVPDGAMLSAAAQGQSSTGFDLGVRTRDTDVAVEYRGYVQVPSDGAYTFYVTSDTGATLRIHEALVVDDDAPHTGAERSGAINLKAGLHPIRVTYWHTTGTQTLSVKYSSSTITKQTIPTSVLYRSTTSQAQPPTITTLPNQTTTEGVAVGPLAFTISDGDTGANSLVLSATSSNPDLVPVARVVFGGSGGSRTATITPIAGQSGVATLTVTVSDGAATATTTFTFTVTSSLPSPWQHQDVGGPAATGSASHVGGVFTVNGDGTDLGGVADQGHFVWQTLNGDGSITTRVASQQATDPYAKAGVMMRESLAKDSAQTCFYLTPGNGYALGRRGRTGAWTWTTADGAANAAPNNWVRLVRSGQTIKAYRSGDGTNWTLVKTCTVAMGTDIYVGLAVSSRRSGTVGTATFDNVTVVP